MRAHDLDDRAYAALAQAAFARCEAAGARLLLNRDPEQARHLPHHGLHLSARALSRLERRPLAPDGSTGLVGASCHDQAELARAAALGLDYALLSPVRPTPTHPDARPLGWDRFAALADPVPLPIYALGGIDPDDLDQAFRHGAQGIAGIRGFWPE